MSPFQIFDDQLARLFTFLFKKLAFEEWKFLRDLRLSNRPILSVRRRGVRSIVSSKHRVLRIVLSQHVLRGNPNSNLDPGVFREFWWVWTSASLDTSYMTVWLVPLANKKIRTNIFLKKKNTRFNQGKFNCTYSKNFFFFSRV